LKDKTHPRPSPNPTSPEHSQKQMLPINNIIPDLLNTLESQTTILLQAPPGAGKTTRVPLALMDAPWREGRKILMLEPRRLAARSAARYMAGQMGEKPGQAVGYRTRLDTRVTSATVIEVVTEGILTRLIQNDPALEDYAVVIFDEFHERSLQADLGLALVREARQALREDLRIIVMSATLDTAPMAGRSLWRWRIAPFRVMAGSSNRWCPLFMRHWRIRVGRCWCFFPVRARFAGLSVSFRTRQAMM